MDNDDSDSDNSFHDDGDDDGHPYTEQILLRNLKFEYVNEITFNLMWLMSHPLERFKEGLRLVNIQNITKLSLDLPIEEFKQIQDQTNFINCLVAVPSLVSIEIKFLFGESDQIIGFLQQVIVSKIGRFDSLEVESSMDIVDAVNVLDLDGIRTIDLCSLCGTNFIMRNRYMIIKDLNLPLIDTFNKFNHVKFIDVISFEDDYLDQVRTDIEVIRNNLPRNRYVQLNTAKKQSEEETDTDCESSDLDE